MSYKQGFIRLSKGILKELTPSEKDRGYLFISNDKLVKEIKSLKVFVNNQLIKITHTDNSGRIIIGKKILAKVGSSKLQIKLQNNEIKIKF